MFKTVRGKFSLINIGLVALIVLLGALSVYRLARVNRTVQDLVAMNYDSIVRLADMERALWQQDRDIVDYLYDNERRAAARHFADNTQLFTQLLDAEKGTLFIPEEILFADEIAFTYQSYVDTFESLQAFNLADDTQRELAVRFYEDDIRAHKELVETAMGKLHNSNEAALLERRDEARQSVALSVQITAVVFLIAAAAGLLFSSVYTRRFFAPLYEITENVRRVREGDIDRKIPVHAKDEFGMLAEEFNRMTSRLAEFERSTLGSLMNERSRSDSLVKSVHEPLVVLDEAGRLVLMNSAFEQLFGLSEENSLGKPFTKLVPRPAFSAYTAALQEGSLTRPQDSVVTLPAEEDDLFFRLAATPIPGPEGKTAGLIILMHDITEMKRLEKMRGDYIATISHEFKTPLTSIVMGADLVGNRMIGTLNDDQQEIVATIKEDLQRLEMLVEDVIELSKMESSSTFYTLAPCEPCRLVEASAAQFRTPAARGGVALAIDCPAGLPRVQADFPKITWVLNNLLSNALKYTREGDSITVSARQTGVFVEFSVTDTGMGVPPEFVDQIFEKYVQIKSYDIEVRGSGLGLAAAREIILAHKGGIWCDTSVQSGSRFVFTLKADGEEKA